jgi:hypothetical protein
MFFLYEKLFNRRDHVISLRVRKSVILKYFYLLLIYEFIFESATFIFFKNKKM